MTNAPLMREQERSRLQPLSGQLFLLALVVFFLAARILDDDTLRIVALAVAALLVGASSVLKWRASSGSNERVQAMSRLALATYGVGTLSAVVAWWAFSSSSPPVDGAAAAEGTTVSGPLLVASLIGLVGAFASTLALEFSAAPMRAAGYAEPRRAAQAVATALTLVAAIGGAMLLNFAAQRRDTRADFSSGTRTKLSQATIGLVQASATPVEIFLFFEKGSPMVPELVDFYAPLKTAGATITVQDHALDPELAEEMKISRTGTVGFRVGSRSEKWFIGDGRDALSRKLRRADEETRTRLSRITRDEKHVYFTVGHGERKDSRAPKGERLGGESFRVIARALNASMRKLGFAEGLGRDVPEDASVVVIFGPTKPFLEEEQASLMRYLERGGSIAILLDPFVDHGLDRLLASLRFKMSQAEVANDKEFIRRSHTAADHAILFSNNFASHQTTRELKKAGGRAAVLLLSAGELERIPAADGAAGAFGKGSPRVTVTMRSRPTSFVDVKPNRTFDDKIEKRSVLNFAAVIEQPIDDTKSARALLVSDSDAFADGLLPNEANQAFAYEAMAWLVRDDKIGGALNIDDDVPIFHTQDEDTVIFYGTTVAAPMLVALIGLLVMRRRRARRRQSGGTK